jgi:hypothetical protein
MANVRCFQYQKAQTIVRVIKCRLHYVMMNNTKRKHSLIMANATHKINYFLKICLSCSGCLVLTPRATVNELTFWLYQRRVSWRLYDII